MFSHTPVMAKKMPPALPSGAGDNPPKRKDKTKHSQQCLESKNASDFLATAVPVTVCGGQLGINRLCGKGLE